MHPWLRTIPVLGVCVLATPLLVSAQTPHATQPVATAPPPGVLLAVEEEVMWIRGARIEKASRGMPLDVREGVETMSGGALIVWRDAVVIALGDDSVLHALSPDRFRLARGRMVVMVPAQLRGTPDASGFTPTTIVIENGGTRLDLLQPGEYEVQVDGKEGDRQTMHVAVRVGRAGIGDGERTLRVDPRKSAKMRAGDAPRNTFYVKKSKVGRFETVLARLRDIRDGRTPLSAQYLPSSLHSYAWLFDLFGSWYVDESYGHYWVPRVADAWQPYGAGRWVYRDSYGWVWLDDAEWGWITQHYGRWTMDARGTWAWRPDIAWSPGWVRWEVVEDEVVWCPLGWDDYPAYDYPYDRSRERWRGSVPRREWLSARQPRQTQAITPDLTRRWPAGDPPMAAPRPPVPPAGPRPPVTSPPASGPGTGLANVAVPREPGTAVPRLGGTAVPRGGDDALSRAVRRDEGDAARGPAGVAVPRNPLPGAQLSGTAIPRHSPQPDDASLAVATRTPRPPSATHAASTDASTEPLIPARSPQRASSSASSSSGASSPSSASSSSGASSAGSATTDDAADRNREAWDRYYANLARDRARDRSRDGAEHSSTRAPSAVAVPRRSPPPEPSPTPTSSPEPESRSAPEPSPEPTPAPRAVPRDPDPPSRRDPDPPPRREPDPPPSRPEPPPDPPPAESRPDPPRAEPRQDPPSDPPAERAVPRNPDAPPADPPSRRPPDERSSDGPRRRHP